MNAVIHSLTCLLKSVSRWNPMRPLELTRMNPFEKGSKNCAAAAHKNAVAKGMPRRYIDTTKRVDSRTGRISFSSWQRCA